MKKQLISLVISLLALPVMAGGDIDKGKAKSAACAACHGADGIGIADIYPNLAGQKEAYILSQLKAFRDGQRKNAMMSPMVKGLSDDDLANLAAYYASLSPVKK